MRRRASVRIDDDLAARDSGVAMRTAHHESTGRVHVDLGVRIAQLFRNDAVDDLVDDVGLHRFLRDVRAVLARHHHGIHPHRAGAVVFDRHLRFAIRAEVLQQTVPPRAREALGELVCEHDRQRHQLFRLSARKAEHEALVAGAAGVDAHRDIGRLAVNGG